MYSKSYMYIHTCVYIRIWVCMYSYTHVYDNHTRLYGKGHFLDESIHLKLSSIPLKKSKPWLKALSDTAIIISFTNLAVKITQFIRVISTFWNLKITKRKITVNDSALILHFAFWNWIFSCSRCNFSFAWKCFQEI